ncbi:ABC transporter ATP-binding protein [Microbacterium album]|uniref:Peptide ABC transporter ATP-binding protein n=1 Tax=Microbacterium album TaxID=2053191 RepID=A0A917MNF2_9MICO|nr:ABC transporter ATP-binding protein [Microbacterium album]GGH41025.1 peptide ABC transporter ATP-binding protein [Microbacterium album]
MSEVRSDVLLDVRDLRCTIPTPRGDVKVLSGVNVTLDRGQTLGLVGESGSGKSMFVRSLMGITPPQAVLEGTARFDGQDLLTLPKTEARQIWGRRIGMVFQDPMTSLNPVVRIGRQVGEAAEKHLGLTRQQARRRAIELLELVGIPEPGKRHRSYPHEFSGGMRQRVTIAMALACEPDLLIADEATTALDVTVQQQILDLLQEIQRERHMAMILVSHDLGVVSDRCDEVAVMYAGRIVEHAPTDRLFAEHRHRYTGALLRAIPRFDRPKHSVLETIEGTPPNLAALPPGCAFAPRCRFSVDACTTAVPPMTPAEDERHRFACYNPSTAEDRRDDPVVSPGTMSTSKEAVL